MLAVFLNKSHIMETLLCPFDAQAVYCMNVDLDGNLGLFALGLIFLAVFAGFAFDIQRRNTE